VDLSFFFSDACVSVHPARLLVVFHQFEEFLILHDEQQRSRFVEFITMLAASRDHGSGILLVFRSEYDGFIQNLDLPTPIPGRNLQKSRQQ
jgi:hypothetical protein